MSIFDTIQAGDLALPKGRAIGSQLPAIVKGKACGAYLQGCGHSQLVADYISTGTLNTSKENGIRALIFTGFLGREDLSCPVTEDTGKLTAKMRTLYAKGFCTSISYLSHARNCERLQGSKQCGFKLGARYAEVSITDKATRDELVQAGFTGVSDINTFPQKRFILAEAGHSVAPVPAPENNAPVKGKK